MLNLSLIYETLWTGVRKWFFNFNAGKPQLVLFDWSNDTGAIDIKMDGPILDEKSYFGIFWGSVTNINIKINTEHNTTAKYRPDNSKLM